MLKPPQKLPVYNPSDINPDLVDSALRSKTRLHRVDTFTLIDQNGDIVTHAYFDNKIYVTDFFFTTCQSICPIMTNQMKRVYDAYEKRPEILFLSHTVMPEVDSVAILKAYALKFGAESERWKFVTGSKKKLYELARKSYFVVNTLGNGDEHDFIHTENLVLVDTKKKIRGYYDGTSEQDVDRLIKELQILLDE